MKSIFYIIFLGSRLVLASVLALAAQIWLWVKSSDHLLLVQDHVRQFSVLAFEQLQLPSQYRVAYNFIGGDNLIVHTIFVLIAYTLILIILWPVNQYFRRR